METTHKRPLWLAGLTAIGGATIGNVVALFALRPLVIDPNQPLHALSLGPVVTLTVAGALGAIFVYAILRYFLKHPNRVFVSSSILFLLVSFIPDYLILHSTTGTFAGANLESVGLLMLMHVIAAVTIVYSLVSLTRPYNTQVTENGAPPPLF